MKTAHVEISQEKLDQLSKLFREFEGLYLHMKNTGDDVLAAAYLNRLHGMWLVLNELEYDTDIDTNGKTVVVPNYFPDA